MRAVAVGMVVVFHFWPAQLPGGFVGVDVFFVISGFLITSHLLREIAGQGRVHLGQFWARRVRRLLPAAMLVLVATLVAVVAFLPQPVWQRTVREVAASALYAENWALAGSAADYFASEDAATAVQHYWSLSVEEQFYIVWPLLIIAAVWAARRRAVSARAGVGVSAGVVLVVSLAYSVWFTSRSPQAAYFSTFTHAWEFAAGALTAVVAPAFAAMRPTDFVRTRTSAAVVGLGTLVACGFVYTGAMAFPGWVAVVPVAATIAVILAGQTLVERQLAARPVQLLGDVSYSLYLWHWPVIVIAPFALGRELDTPTRLALLAGTILLAWGTKVAVEDPVRRARRFAAARRWAFGFAGLTAVAVVAACAVVWTGVADQEAEALEAARSADSTCLGAAAILSGNDCPAPYRLDDDLLLATETITDDAGDAATPREINLGGSLNATETGDPDSETTVVLLGDSHAGHYNPALSVLAEQNGWRLLTVRFNNCSPSAPTWDSPVGADMLETCRQWRRDLLTLLPEVPDVDVIVTSSVSPRYGNVVDDATYAQIRGAFAEMWDAWTASGKAVVVIADVPGPSEAIGETDECVAAADTVDDPCTTRRADVLEPDAMVDAARGSDNVTLVDFTDVYCGEETCHSVVGGIVVYGGGAHISRLFSLSLAPYLEGPIQAALRRPGT